MNNESIKKPRGQKLTKEQKMYLTDFMVQNEHVAHRKFTASFTQADYKRKLKDMTDALNKMGATKTAEQWLKTWADMKLKSKEKAARLNRSQVMTGGGSGVPINSLSLSTQKILAVSGGRKLFAGSDLTNELDDGYCEIVTVKEQNISFQDEERPGTSRQSTYKIEKEIVQASLLDETPKKLATIRKKGADSVPEALSQKKNRQIPKGTYQESLLEYTKRQTDFYDNLPFFEKFLKKYNERTEVERRKAEALEKLVNCFESKLKK